MEEHDGDILWWVLSVCEERNDSGVICFSSDVSFLDNSGSSPEPFHSSRTKQTHLRDVDLGKEKRADVGRGWGNKVVGRDQYTMIREALIHQQPLVEIIVEHDAKLIDGAWIEG